MTGAELITEIRDHLDEPVEKGDYFTDTRILSVINRVYRKVVRRTGCIVKMTNYVDQTTTRQNVVASTASSPRHPLPTDWMQVHPIYGVFWASDGRQLRGTTMYEMQNVLKIWDGVKSSGTPIYYTTEDINEDVKTDYTTEKYIFTYPYPSAVGYNLEAYYIPQPTSLTTSTSPLMEEDFQELLIWGPVEIFKAKREKWQAVNYYNAQYMTLLAKAVSYYNRKDKETNLQRSKLCSPGGGENITINAASHV